MLHSTTEEGLLLETPWSLSSTKSTHHHRPVIYTSVLQPACAISASSAAFLGVKFEVSNADCACGASEVEKGAIARRPLVCGFEKEAVMASWQADIN